jgi:hypothetical protein
MESTTTATVETAATAAMKATAAGESASNCGPAAVSAAIGHPASITITITRPAIVAAAIAIVAAAISVPVPAIAIPVAAIPGSRTDEDSAEEPRRSIVPVRRAGIRIVTVIAISADRSGIAIAPNSNSNRDLSMRVGRRRH